jgi:hypothetical protein
MDWVKQFANDLEALGNFEIYLDQNLPKGLSFTRFMEVGIANADKVLVIGTPDYKRKAEARNGVAFEEAIISTELMQDIDTLKYYPILRSGTFDTSFPPILQGRNGDDLTNDEEYQEKLQIIADAILNEKPLPKIFSKEDKTISSPKVAEVYFSQDLLLTTYYGRPSGEIEGIAFSVTITNHSKEGRYYYEPSFKLSVPIEGDADAFKMLNVISTPLNYPVKLEFGQQFRVSYKLMAVNMGMFERLLKKENKATIHAYVYTTLNEAIESNSIPLIKVVENAKYVR